MFYVLHMERNIILYIIYIYVHTGSKNEQKRKSNLIAHCYIDCFSRQ